MTWVAVLVVTCYAAIHTLEYAGYYARVAGHLAGRRATGYAIQNAVNTVTRFFYLLMMPMLGFMVDKGMSPHGYLLMGLAALAGAACGCAAVHALRLHCVAWLLPWVAGKSQWRSCLPGLAQLRAAGPCAPARGPCRPPAPVARLAVPACLVFTCYALGVLLAYFCALAVHDYRATISQLSGVVNGLATVLLTFVLEPRIARIIDRQDAVHAYFAIQALLRGRLVAIGVAAPSLFLLAGYALAG